MGMRRRGLAGAEAPQPVLAGHPVHEAAVGQPFQHPIQSHTIDAAAFVAETAGQFVVAERTLRTQQTGEHGQPVTRYPLAGFTYHLLCFRAQAFLWLAHRLGSGLTQRAVNMTQSVTMRQRIPCFKAYDIRGRVPDELDADLAWRIGAAYARVIAPAAPVAIGRDNRLTSPDMATAVAAGLNAAGVATRELGLCGTETVYHAAARSDMGGGIMVTASHNPADYNGMKLVRAGAAPISSDSGLSDIEASAAEMTATPGTPDACLHQSLDVMPGYVRQILSLIDTAALKPLRIVVNAGNGAAGPTVDALAARLPFTLHRIHHEPDGRFPHGVPNPLLPENRQVTAEAVRAHRADFGVAWDGDFDRCFLFDEQGRFIEGYYIVGLLAARLLEKFPGGKIIHDPRLTWNTIDLVREAGGVPIVSKTGHAFIKERMRREQALYGGEMSAHHYFRDFACCDSGMLPWLLIAEQLSRSGQALSALVDERIAAWPCSGEINFTVDDPTATMIRVTDRWIDEAINVDYTDGVSLEFSDWRFNLRSSNTEPVIRLNVETRADRKLLARRTTELRTLISDD